MVDPRVVQYVNPKRTGTPVDDVIPTAKGIEVKMDDLNPPTADSSKAAKVDNFMNNINKMSIFFSDMQHYVPMAERPGIPTIEKDVGSMTTYPPPSFSMLQEMEMNKALERTYSGTGKKSAKKTPKKSKKELLPQTPPSGRTPPSPRSPVLSHSLSPESGSASRISSNSLFDRLKEKVFSGSRTPVAENQQIVPVTTPAIQEPSPIGMDDTMKSPSEISKEEEIRSTWDRIRDQSRP